MNTNRNPHLSNYVAITENGAVELAENTETKFKRFWKQIAGYGDFVDPRKSGEKMRLDKAWGERIVDNFKNGPIKRVPVPTGHPQTSSELAERTKGWLMDAEAREDGLYGLIETRDADTAQKIEDGLIADTSVAFDDVYRDKRTGKMYRDVLKHVGLVNDPYIKDMPGFEAALCDDNSAMVLFSDGDSEKDNNEEIQMSTVTNNRDFPVEVKYQLEDSETTATIEPGASLEVPDDQTDAVEKQIKEAVKPDVEEDDTEELSDAEKALADREEAVAKAERELAEQKAEAEFTKLLNDGKVVPAQKNAFLALSSQGSATVELSDGESKTVGVLLSEFLTKIPKGLYLDENGVSGGDSDEDDIELTSEQKSLTDLGVSEEDLKETLKQEKGDE